MKRWNGWGDTAQEYPVPHSAESYLIERLGELDPQPDATLESVINSVPASRLPSHPLVDRNVMTRLTHARGQSTPDWVALRSGRIPVFPDGVGLPTSTIQVRELLDFSSRIGAKVIPYGGGSSVVGHINPIASDAPVLTVSLEKMTHLVDLDEIGQTAVFEAGVTGPELELSLAGHGYTLGHFPQSHEYSTLGGWIATRSSGQQSYHYGRIEALFAGGHLESPCGPIDLPHFPASAAGPDLRELVLGSEGRLGIITTARVRVSRTPGAEDFFGVFFPTWEQGLEAVRQIAQQRVQVSMLRLSSPQETETTLILSGKPWLATADMGLRLLGYGSTRCLLVFGATGTITRAARARTEAAAICRKYSGLFVGTVVGHTWKKSRFYTPYLRNSLWDRGVVVDTLETALPWSRVLEASRRIPDSISQAMLGLGEKVLVFDHLSHVYRDGASVYTTFLFRRPGDPDELLARWQVMKTAASRMIQELGGTITHQHGVGIDHAPYLVAEKGELGVAAIRAACSTFDPDEMMNPGKLY